MSKSPSKFNRAVLAGTAVAAAAFALSAPAQAEQIVGLIEGNRLIRFDSATPGTTSAPVAVTGLGAGQTLVGIDLRPTTGLIYGLASNGAIYTLNATTGAATLVTTISGAVLNGSTFGVDFNPVPDLAGLASFRITSDTGQNLRVNVNPGASLGVAAVDSMLNGAGTSLSASAYDNNDINPATGTTLYGIFGNTIFKQNPANAGTLIEPRSLGVTTGAFTGFDVSASGASFASLTAPDALTSSFYSINLVTGPASLIGAFAAFGGVGSRVVDITAAMAPIPEPETYALMLVGLAGVAFVARRRRAKAG